MEIRVYRSDKKEEWDGFVRESKNGTFLFYRDFMEYHKDRFNDYSLMFYLEEQLVALMPGHIKDHVYYSHQGLTYGGLVMSYEITTSNVLSIFENLSMFLRQQDIKEIIYKAIPHIYHKLPAEEDLYALFRYNAVLTERNISSTILLPEKLEYSDSRKNGLKKAKKNKLTVGKSNDLDVFWSILSDNLKLKYNKTPVHSLSEIIYLKEQFQDEIHLYSVFDEDGMMLAGCVAFEMTHVVHIQYTAATEEGKNKGAIDMVIDYLINSEYSSKRYFDYGISTENNGLYLNESLIYQKEGFGARGIIYDIYTINL